MKKTKKMYKITVEPRREGPVIELVFTLKQAKKLIEDIEEAIK